jgi:hypothetical protein
MDCSPISSPHVSRGLAELAVVAVSRIGEDRGPGNAIGDCPLKLFGGAERFGTEDDFVRSPGLLTALRVLAPAFRQVGLVGDRKAGGVGADREADGLLASCSSIAPPRRGLLSSGTMRPLLILRTEQMRVFEENMRNSWLLAELRQLEPAAALLLKHPQCDEFVGRAAAAARSLGIESPESTLRYVRVCLALGEDFARNPALPWVRKVLGDADLLWLERLDLLEANLLAGAHNDG